MLCSAKNTAVKKFSRADEIRKFPKGRLEKAWWTTPKRSDRENIDRPVLVIRAA